ncbi:hypothetical protein NPIL_151201 [Nephila pilipes]|uniref:Uncharacterized protein n=1 Tax=Nephila pilipes TaxID=299642 RepID=A0A8X6U434_NEPPI|nr:hypothetical protein NPIL_151201 [Nephila pilipes]
MLYTFVESALPDETLKAWERFRTAHRRLKEETSEESTSCSKEVYTNDLDCLLDFLQDEIEGEERILITTQSFDQSKKSSYSNNRREANERKLQPRISSAIDLLA